MWEGWLHPTLPSTTRLGKGDDGVGFMSRKDCHIKDGSFSKTVSPSRILSLECLKAYSSWIWLYSLNFYAIALRWLEDRSGPVSIHTIGLTDWITQKSSRTILLALLACVNITISRKIGVDALATDQQRKTIVASPLSDVSKLLKD